MRSRSRKMHALRSTLTSIILVQIEEAQRAPLLRHDLTQPRRDRAINDHMQEVYEECASDPELARELGLA